MVNSWGHVGKVSYLTTLFLGKPPPPEGSLPVLSAHSFTSNWQLVLPESAKEEYWCLGKQSIYELRHEKTNVLHMRKQRSRTAKLISAFVFATQIVRSLYFLNPKFQASFHHLWLYRPVYVRPDRKPEFWFSHDAAHMCNFSNFWLFIFLKWYTNSCS